MSPAGVFQLGLEDILSRWCTQVTGKLVLAIDWELKRLSARGLDFISQEPFGLFYSTVAIFQDIETTQHS